MARSNRPGRLTSRSFYDPHAEDRYLHPMIVELLNVDDPALAEITARVTEARMGGADLTNTKVLEQCITQGREDYALSLVDGVA